MSAMARALIAELTDSDLDALADLLAPRLAVRTQMAHDPESWLTVDQAAGYLSCQPQRIYNLVSQRRLRHVKDGSRVLFRRQWLDDHLQGSS